VKQLGLRGVKLHPRSDGWSNEIDSEPVENLLVEAAKLGVPVIFDTRGFNQVVDIASVTVKARARLARIDKRLTRQLKIIIAHIGFHLGYDELYTVLSHPNIYGEVSGIQSSGVQKLFEDAPLKLGENLEPYYSWSEKIIFGTDFPYFDVYHAAQFISYVLSDDFPGTIHDAQRILGVNILRLIPPRMVNVPRELKSVHVDSSIFPLTRKVLASKITKLFSEKKIDISSFDEFLSLPPKASVKDGCLLLLKNHGNNGKDVFLALLPLINFGVVTLFESELPDTKQLTSRELGYDEFSSRRQFYEKLWPVTVEKDSAELERKLDELLNTFLESVRGDASVKLNMGSSSE
ncbi:MAG: amidohydrolase family protein, partial [Candidatus Jordarchaeales archaeon]